MAFSVKKIPLRANRLPLRAKLLKSEIKSIILNNVVRKQKIKNTVTHFVTSLHKEFPTVK